MGLAPRRSSCREDHRDWDRAGRRGRGVGVGATKALGQVGDGELLAPSSVPARPAVYSSGTLSGAVYGMRVLTPSYS